jgi:aminopeptidase N
MSNAAHLALALVLTLVAVPPILAAPDEPERDLHEAPARRFDLIHRELKVRFDFAKKSVEGTATLAGVAIAPLESLELNARELTVTAVTDSARGPLTFENDGRIVTVHLAAPIQRGERAVIAVTYSAHPRARLYWVVPDKDHPKRRAEVWSQGEDELNRFWFPDIDHPVERATSDLYYTVPAAMTAVGNGRLVETTAGLRPGEKTWHWQMTFPHVSYLVSVAASAYAKRDTTWRGIPVEYYVGPDLVERVPRSFGRTPEMMEFFSTRFGVPYPYAKYAQVVVQDYMHGGMENISATTLVERSLIDRESVGERGLSTESLVAHELGHQWFGDYVTCRDWTHAWINEGSASYCSNLWFEHAYGRDEMDRSLIESRDAYFREDATNRHPVVDPSYAVPGDQFGSTVYSKGAWVLHMLRRRLGDEAFFRGWKRYLETNAGHSVDTQSLRLAFEAESGESLEGFFTQWLMRAGYPRLQVHWDWLDDRKMARVTVEQTQPSDSLTPVFRFRLPLRFALDGAEERSSLDVDGRHAETYVALPSRPRYVEINDDLSVLCAVDFDRPVRELADQLREAPRVASRIEAARSLGAKSGSPEAREALARALREQPSYAVRHAAALALGRAPTPEAYAALETALADRDPRVRRAAVSTLGGFRNEPKAAAAAKRALSDPAPGVVNQGLMALARLRTPDAYAELTKALARPSAADSMAAAACAALAELGDARAILKLVDATRPARNLPQRIAATTALGTLGGTLPQEPANGWRQRADVRRELEHLAWDERMQVRRSAATALGNLGERLGIETLTTMIGSDVEASVVSAAVTARRKLRGQGETSTADLKQRIEKLAEENKALETRLKALEASTPRAPAVPQ